jgi:histidine ammonia-lyase
MSLNLTPGKVSLTDLSQIYWESPSVTLNPEAKQAVEKAAGFVEKAANADSLALLRSR